MRRSPLLCVSVVFGFVKLIDVPDEASFKRPHSWPAAMQVHLSSTQRLYKQLTPLDERLRLLRKFSEFQLPSFEERVGTAALLDREGNSSLLKAVRRACSITLSQDHDNIFRAM